MRRFIADACLILLLVAIGSYVADDHEKDREELHNKIEEFESSVAQNKPAQPQVDKSSLNEIDENFASSMAKRTSQFIVDLVDTSTVIVSDIFHGLAE